MKPMPIRAAFISKATKEVSGKTALRTQFLFPEQDSGNVIKQSAIRKNVLL